jgi:hypothetical protein
VRSFGVRKTPFLSHVNGKNHLLPRQARDRHGESGEQEGRFFGRGRARRLAQQLAVRKKRLCQLFPMLFF